MLLRLDASTKWFRELILPNAEIRLFDDRLHFVNEDGVAKRSDHASILAMMNESKKRLDLPIIYWRKLICIRKVCGREREPGYPYCKKCRELIEEGEDIADYITRLKGDK